MAFDPVQHHRRSIRLREYNYADPGNYFITICTANRQCMFGSIVDGVVILSRYGEIARKEWLRSATLRPEMTLDEFVVMPNHVHGIVTVGSLDEALVGAHGNAPRQSLARRPRSISTFVGSFKGSAVRQINTLRRAPGAPVWQRNDYEHIIRDEEELERIRRYVVDNPHAWKTDEYYSEG